MITAENNVFLQEETKQTPQRCLATVTGITAGLKIILDGESHSKAYMRLASYTPTVGDRVFIVPVSGTYIVIGKVI